jgi:hypothetical protein
MSAIPLHIERRFEQRWAARFFSPAASAVPKRSDLKRTANSSPRPAKTREKPAELGKRV